MPLVEIDEALVQRYQQTEATLQAMLKNPKARRKVLEAQRDINPDLPIPELDAAEPVMSAVEELRTGFKSLSDELKADREERVKEKNLSALQQKWDRSRTALRADGWNDEGLTALEAFMEKHGIADHEIAVPAFEKHNPPAEIAPPSGGDRFDIFRPEARDDDTMKMLFDGNDEGFLRAVIPQTLAEVRNGARR